MQSLRSWTLGIAVVLPVLGLAAGAAAKGDKGEKSSAKSKPETQAERTTDTATEVKGLVLPAFAGIQSAEVSVAAVHELANDAKLQRKDLRKAAELAEQGVRVAQKSADDLKGIKGLSGEAKNEAQAAAAKLKEARTSVEHIQRQVGLTGAFRKDEADTVRQESMKLHAALGEAQQSLQKVAGRFQVSTRLELGDSERQPVRGKR